MHPTHRLLTALCLCAGSLFAQAPTPPPLKVDSGPAGIPKNAKPADIQDVRVLTQAQAPDDPYEFERLGLAAITAGTLPRARKFFERSWELGELPTAAYNIACVDAREGKLDAAMAHLKEANAAGFDDEQTLLSDSDLAALRTKPEFAALVDGARKNKTAGDAAVVQEGVFLAPQGTPSAILVLLHDSSSDPLRASGAFADEAKSRGLYLVAPRGPARQGRHGFGWGAAPRAFVAIETAVDAARRRAGRPDLPVLLVGIGRGGSLAFAKASISKGFAGVGSIGGPFDRGLSGKDGVSAAGLRGVRLFMGIPMEAPQGKLQAFHRGETELRSLGLTPRSMQWAGAGTTLPPNVRAAVKQTLDAVTGSKG